MVEREEEEEEEKFFAFFPGLPCTKFFNLLSLKRGGGKTTTLTTVGGRIRARRRRSLLCSEDRCGYGLVHKVLFLTQHMENLLLGRTNRCLWWSVFFKFARKKIQKKNKFQGFTNGVKRGSLDE